MTLRKAQHEYSKALQDISTGFRALALDLERTVAKIAHFFEQMLVASKAGMVGMVLGSKSIIGGGQGGRASVGRGGGGGKPSQGFW